MSVEFQDPQLPGADLVRQGLADLEREELTEAALLVLIAAPRLRRLGVPIPVRVSPRPFEHELYERLEMRLGPGAHAFYNSLLRRMVSYAHTLEQEQGRPSDGRNLKS